MQQKRKEENYPGSITLMLEHYPIIVNLSIQIRQSIIKNLVFTEKMAVGLKNFPKLSKTNSKKAIPKSPAFPINVTTVFPKTMEKQIRTIDLSIVLMKDAVFAKLNSRSESQIFSKKVNHEMTCKTMMPF